MKNSITLLFFFFILSSSFPLILSFDLKTKSILFQTLLSKINSKREAPQDYEKYITDLVTKSDFFFGNISNTSDIPSLQQSLSFSEHTVKVFEYCLASNSTEKVEIISESTFLSNSQIREFLGATIYDPDGGAYYIIFRAETSGRVLQQTEKKTERHCKKKFLHKKHCWDEEYEVPRANNAQEIEGMKQVVLSKSLLGLKSSFYEENEKVLKELNDEMEKAAQEGGVGEDGKEIDPVQKKIQEKKGQFMENLRKLVDLSRQRPEGYEKLVRNIKSFTDVNMDMFDKNEVEAICAKYSLPDDVKNKLKTIAFVSEDIATDEIKYLYNMKTASCEEILGFVMKEQDKIFFAFIRSVTEGEMPLRTKNVSVKLCHHTLFGKSCHHEGRVVEDPYTAQELEIVKKAITALSSESLKNKLDTISESQTLLGSGKIVSPDGKIAAIMNKDGRIIVGPVANPLEGTLYTIGTVQEETFAPYSLQVKENGNLYIINKNNDKVWTSDTSNQGKGPFKLILDNDGQLSLVDSENKVIFNGKQ